MRLSTKQAEYVKNANKLINFKIGAKGSGKTFIDTAFIIPNRIIERKSNKDLVFIIGVSKETVERNVLKSLRKHFGSLVGEINSRNVCHMFGQDVYCLGAEKINQVTKLQGATAKYVYGDEVVRWHEEVFISMLATLRSPDGCSCFDGSCNPEEPSHYIKQFVDNLEIQDDLYVQEYTIDDNTFYPEKNKQALKRQYQGTVFYDRYILGKWTKAEGLIYPNFSVDSHVVDVGDKEFDYYYVSYDFGTKHPCVFLLFGKNKYESVLIKEYYYNGETKGQKTVREYLDDFINFTAGYNIKRVFYDKAPISASFNTELSRSKLYVCVKADNEVLRGIQDVATALNTNILFIDSSCTNTIREFGSYSWEANKEEPMKINDDAMDALRYYVRTMKIAMPKRASII